MLLHVVLSMGASLGTGGVRVGDGGRGQRRQERTRGKVGDPERPRDGGPEGEGRRGGRGDKEGGGRQWGGGCERGGQGGEEGKTLRASSLATAGSFSAFRPNMPLTAPVTSDSFCLSRTTLPA